MYEFYIEKQKVDIEQQSAVALTYAIDDINQYGSRETTFSKPLTLLGTARTNKVLGHVLTDASNNPYSVLSPNVGVNFNPSDVALCELRYNGLLLVKGVFRLISIRLENRSYKYEGVIFGELGGFVANISNLKLEDLDFSEYNHILNTTNIQASWDTINGSSYYYPLIDYGTFSTAKVNYDIRTLRPALYVKEYIDKIFEDAGFTYESDFLNTALFKALIVPHNTKRLTKLDNSLLDADFNGSQVFSGTGFIEFDTAIGGNFTSTINNSLFTYNQANAVNTMQTLFIDGVATINGSSAVVQVIVANTALILAEITLGDGGGVPYNFGQTISFDYQVQANDELRIRFVPESRGDVSVEFLIVRYDITTFPPTIVNVDEGDTVDMNYTIPKGIFQREFFSSILKMFNLYVTEDPIKENHLIIQPYIQFYDLDNPVDWNQKIDYSKTLEYVPMGQLNGRIFEYKYKSDTDFYNEAYQKKFNQSYGDLLYDTGFQFSKDRQTLEIIFSPTPLIQYSGTDKILPAIYKKSSGNDIDQEELTDSNIRILFAKKVTGVTSWDILDGVTVLSSQTAYGYAGHLDDPDSPTYDLNFGAPSELYFTVGTYPNRGLFNEYWNDYILEIANKDSKILKCYAYLKASDIAALDFSRPVFINGVKYRINKVEDYNSDDPITRVELLKVING